MGKWQRRGPRPSPLTETIPSVQLEGGGCLFSPKNFSVTPQALTVKHTDFSVLSTSRRSLGPFFRAVWRTGVGCSSFPSWWNLWALSVIPLKEAFHLRAAESKTVRILQPMCALSSYFSSKVNTSEHWVCPHRAWVHLSSRSPCLHVKALT